MTGLRMRLRSESELNFVALSGAPKVVEGEAEGVKAHSKALPSLRLTDPRFNYRRACDTDLAETFRRARAGGAS